MYDTCEDAITLYELILDYTKVENITDYSLKLLGPLVRVANYRYDILLKQ
jgi:hypothetical protein